MKRNLHRSKSLCRCKRWLTGLFLAVLGAVLAAGCVGSRGAAAEIVVEGMLTARGNAPFVAQVLETDQQNLYVLVMDDSVRVRVGNPSRLRVTGDVFVADWNGRPFTHLRVRRAEVLGDLP